MEATTKAGITNTGETNQNISKNHHEQKGVSSESSSTPPFMETTVEAEITPMPGDNHHGGEETSFFTSTINRLFRNTVCLAPMVRAGTLPLRLLALQYGADTVWGEEIIDRKIMECRRQVNDAIGTIDFIGKDGKSLIFRTCAQEKSKVVFQLGTRNPEWAVQAAKLVCKDVAAIDLNMGCPKKFSIQDGMGAALLEKKEVAAPIIKALRDAVDIPITCKIRLLETTEKSIEFVRAMEAAGVCAISVHMRTKKDKPTDPARWNLLRPLVEAVKVPIIANGDVYTLADMKKIKEMSGCAALMLGRPALYNVSIFRQIEPLKPLIEVIREYLHLCIRYDNHVINSKYVVQEFMAKRRHTNALKTKLPIDLPADKTIARVCQCKVPEALYELWDLTKDDIKKARRRSREIAAGDEQEEGLSHPSSQQLELAQRYLDSYVLKHEPGKGDRSSLSRKRNREEEDEEAVEAEPNAHLNVNSFPKKMKEI